MFLCVIIPRLVGFCNVEDPQCNALPNRYSSVESSSRRCPAMHENLKILHDSTSNLDHGNIYMKALRSSENSDTRCGEVIHQQLDDKRDDLSLKISQMHLGGKH
jgi:hypothetical protein